MRAVKGKCANEDNIMTMEMPILRFMMKERRRCLIRDYNVDVNLADDFDRDDKYM